MYHHINTPRQDLKAKVIEILREAGPLSIDQIWRRQTITRHQRRIGAVLEELEREGAAVWVEHKHNGGCAKHGYTATQ